MNEFTPKTDFAIKPIGAWWVAFSVKCSLVRRTLWEFGLFCWKPLWLAKTMKDVVENQSNGQDLRWYIGKSSQSWWKWLWWRHKPQSWTSPYFQFTFMIHPCYEFFDSCLNIRPQLPPFFGNFFNSPPTFIHKVILIGEIIYSTWLSDLNWSWTNVFQITIIANLYIKTYFMPLGCRLAKNLLLRTTDTIFILFPTWLPAWLMPGRSGRQTLNFYGYLWFLTPNCRLNMVNVVFLHLLVIILTTTPAISMQFF